LHLTAMDGGNAEMQEQFSACFRRPAQAELATAELVIIQFSAGWAKAHPTGPALDGGLVKGWRPSKALPPAPVIGAGKF
jgi:hypothetical protein